MPKKIDYKNINLETMNVMEEYTPKKMFPSEVATEEMLKLLDDCREYWDDLNNFRERRKRNREFYRGNQWNDLVKDPDNPDKIVSEHDLIVRSGKTPMKNNQLRQLGKNLIGQFRENDSKPVVYPIKKEKSTNADMMTNALQGVLRDQEAKEIDVRLFEEFLLSGFIGYRSNEEWAPEKDMTDIAIDALEPSRMFWNSDVNDIRLKDLNIIGEMHDIPLPYICHTFGEDQEDKDTIREWYAGYGDREHHNWYANTGSDIIDNLDFYSNYEDANVRMYEIWRKELVDKMKVHDWAKGEVYFTDQTAEELDVINQARIQEAAMEGIPEEKVPLLDYEETQEFVWMYYFLTPQGFVLDSDESPFEHQSHPYTIGLYPLLDGEIWGFFEDIIDQQKSINRLITLLDFMVGAGAKGVLLIPEDMLGGKSPEEFADDWVRFNSVIAYKPSKNHTHLPKQITANSQNAGASELLNIQLNLLQEISGVNNAIQGHQPTAGTPAALYAQQTNNAAISNKDFFEFFYSVRRKRDFKVVQLIQQYYDTPRWVNVTGNDYDEAAALYDPEQVKNARYDVLIGVGNNNPVFRQVMDEWLYKFFEMGVIDPETLLENSALPFSDKLLQAIRSKKEEMNEAMQQAGPEGQDTQMLMNQMLGNQSQPQSQVA
jgi:hypothetical protein